MSGVGQGEYGSAEEEVIHSELTESENEQKRYPTAEEIAEEQGNKPKKKKKRKRIRQRK